MRGAGVAHLWRFTKPRPDDTVGATRACRSARAVVTDRTGGGGMLSRSSSSRCGTASRATRRIVFVAIVYAFAGGTGHVATQQRSDTGLDFIDTSFENASPAWYEADRDGTIQIHLLYDHERSSPNRAAGHIHLRLHGTPGAKLTLEFRNLDNVWNGTPASVASELKTLVISEDGRDWKPVATESLPGNRVRLTVVMPGPTLYVARLEPYRLSDLDRLLGSIRNDPRYRSRTLEEPPVAATSRSSGSEPAVRRIASSSGRGRIRGSLAATGSSKGSCSVC